ncbi:tetratricopeptide repeat protein [Nocardia sp. NPDC051052]|uniref:tetratricopeptide repeat protein n=1 Tax=Nocardia sp. NPDC051052 TaxID=3364322 RepID=UPI003794DCAE
MPGENAGQHPWSEIPVRRSGLRRQLATVRRDSGDYEQAASLSRQALTLFRETGFRLGEADALANLGAVCLETGDPELAADLSRQALDLFREIGHQVKEAEAITNIEKALLALTALIDPETDTAEPVGA